MESTISSATQQRLAVSMHSHGEDMAAVAERQNLSLVEAVKKATGLKQRIHDLVREDGFFSQRQIPGGPKEKA